MFLVGATGQLLTLILTVCLPFVFLISGHQNLQVEQSSLNFEVFESPENFVVTNSDSFVASDLFSDEIQTEKIGFKHCVKRKIPHERFHVKWKILCINTSRNKAPPTFSYFSC